MPSLSASDFKLTSIDLYITSQCSRRCTYCFLSDTYLNSRKRLSISSIESILNWADQGSVEEITLLGGEPSLHPNFEAIVNLIYDRGFRVRTVTNGNLKFRSLCSDSNFVSRLSRVAVSLDTPLEDEFNALRGQGAFHDVLDTMHLLKDQGVQFEINSTVVRSTIDSIPDMMTFAEEKGADRLNIHWFSLVGRARNYAHDQAVSSSEWQKVLSLVSSFKPSRSSYVVDCQLGFSLGFPGEDSGMCAVRDRSNLQFMPDGSVFSCGMLVESAELAGYFWNGQELYGRRGDSELSRTAGTCTGCPLRTAEVTSFNSTDIPLCIYNRLIGP
jgi:MoaA/NifB/PqqE/SkfB family radical SAM enzyme